MRPAVLFAWRQIRRADRYETASSCSGQRAPSPGWSPGGDEPLGWFWGALEAQAGKGLCFARGASDPGRAERSSRLLFGGSVRFGGLLPVCRELQTSGESCRGALGVLAEPSLFVEPPELCPGWAGWCWVCLGGGQGRGDDAEPWSHGLPWPRRCRSLR